MTGALRMAPPLPAGARVAFVVNRTSRQGHDRATIDAVARTLGSRYAVDVVVPPTAADVERTVRASSTAHDAVVVAGGDGTIHLAVCGLDGAPTPLGIIPMGTGNDFARGCGIPASPEAAAARILEGRTTAIDLIRVNDRIFCTVGVIGVASDSALTVAHLASPGSPARGLVRLFGDWSYRLVGLGHLLRPGDITERVSLTADSGDVIQAEEPVYALFIANTRVLGGGLVLPIDSDSSDGLMEIAVVPRASRPTLLWAFMCFTRGRPVPAGILRVFRLSRARIDCARVVPFSADGDLMGRGDRFQLSVLPGALNLLC